MRYKNEADTWRKEFGLELVSGLQCWNRSPCESKERKRQAALDEVLLVVERKPDCNDRCPILLLFPGWTRLFDSCTSEPQAAGRACQEPRRMTPLVAQGEERLNHAHYVAETRGFCPKHLNTTFGLRRALLQESRTRRGAGCFVDAKGSMERSEELLVQGMELSEARW